MNEFKYQVVNLILLVLLGFGVYWAFTHIDNGISYDKNTVINTEISDDIDARDSDDVELFDNTKTEDTSTADIFEKKPEEKVTTTKTEFSEEETFLLKKLQGLIDDNINMKDGSKGTRVGTVQKFLNMYLDISKTVDNAYGPGTIADVKKFQEAEGLGVDGLAGPNTYKKMIEVIKK